MGGYLPLVSYLWRGGEVDGEAWCFAYGEMEWMTGTLFDDVRNAADPIDAAGRPKIPVGKTPCI